MHKVSSRCLLSFHTFCSMFSDSVSGQWRPWSDCADAQSDLGLHCPRMPEDTFSHGAAHIEKALVRLECTGLSEFSFCAYLFMVSSARIINTLAKVYPQSTKQFAVVADDIQKLIFYRENKPWHFMWVVCWTDSSHEMPCLISLKNKKHFKVSFAAVAISTLMVNLFRTTNPKII